MLPEGEQRFVGAQLEPERLGVEFLGAILVANKDGYGTYAIDRQNNSFGWF